MKLEDGAPFLLHDFQRTMVEDYFGGTTETLILVSKKNGKTTLLSALALHHLMVTPDAECVIAAASRDQAQILLGQARGFVRRSGLGRYLTVKQREIVSLTGEGRVRVMASDADTADGVIPTLALVDELHRHKDGGAMYGVFRDGIGPRDGRLITISTAGDDTDSLLGRMRAKALAMSGVSRDGAYVCARSSDFVMHEWSMTDGQDRSDMDLVKAANPAPWQTIDALRRRAQSPSMRDWQWARFACGVWLQGEESAISPVEWGACRTDQAIPDAADVWIGIDLGWKWDTTAIVPLHVTNDDLRLVGVPVIVTPPRDGTSTREDQILQPIREMRDRWTIRGVVLDPNAGGEQLAEHLEDMGLEVISHSQDPAPMCLAAERLANAIRERELMHPDDPELNAHVLTAQAKPVGEKWRLVAPSARGSQKQRKVIDGVIALAMVHSVAMSEMASSYDGPLFEVFA